MVTLVQASISAAVIARSGGRREAFCQCTDPPTCRDAEDNADDYDDDVAGNNDTELGRVQIRKLLFFL